MKKPAFLSRFARSAYENRAIKESFDRLPSGVCYFSSEGLPILCNTQMRRLAFALMGKDLQRLDELEESLSDPAPGVRMVRRDPPLYALSDGTFWAVSRSESAEGAPFAWTCYTAADVTELAALEEELAARVSELEEMIEDARRVTDNMAEIVRQQETLAAKMRVHGKMGGALLSANQYALQGCPPEKKAEMLRLWRESLAALQEANEDIPEDAFREACRVASGIGVSVELQGQLPQDPEENYLLAAALRECITNALRHAGADRVFVRVTREEGFLWAEFTNDGKPPEAPVREGGGLTSLREKAALAGASMNVQSLPAFALTIDIPCKGALRR